MLSSGLFMEEQMESSYSLYMIDDYDSVFSASKSTSLVRSLDFAVSFSILSEGT